MTELEACRRANANRDAIIANIRASEREAHAGMLRAEESARFWQASFERLADEIGDLMRAARAGERVTAEQLESILNREANAGSDEERS